MLDMIHEFLSIELISFEKYTITLQSAVLIVPIVLAAFLLMKAWNRFVKKRTLNDVKIVRTITRVFRGLLLFMVFLGVMRVMGVRLNNLYDFLSAILGFRLFTLGGTDVSLLTILIMAVVIWVSLKIARIVRSYFRDSVFARMNIDFGVRASLSKLIGYIIIAIGIIIALQGLGIKLSALTVFAGVLGVGIGFGMQSITANMVSGIVILFERPIKEGDMVRVGDTVGTVRKINLRASVVQTIYNEHLIVPNSEFINATVENMSYEDLRLKIGVKVGVAYGSDPESVREALIEAAGRTEHVMHSLDPYVLFRNFGDSSLDFELFAWIDNPLRRFQTESDLRYEVFRIFKERGIAIPFPQRDVYVKMFPQSGTDAGLKSSTVSTLDAGLKSSSATGPEGASGAGPEESPDGDEKIDPPAHQ